jgi:hypothetical protein
VLVMSLMLGMAVSPFGFMLTDLTSSRYDDDTAVADATSAGSSSSSASWAAPTYVDSVDSIEGLDHAGIGCRVGAAVVCVHTRCGVCVVGCDVRWVAVHTEQLGPVEAGRDKDLGRQVL